MMAAIRIYGKKGEILCKPFVVNTADDDPEAIAEEEQFINSPSASDTEQTDENQGSAPPE